MDTNNNLPEEKKVPEFLTVEGQDGLVFKLEIFEGPLDLLLGLISKNKVNIYDIPIALILDQYLAYIHQMDLFNLEIASEFIVMAAQLMVIKSRLLLPKVKDDTEDPRQELVDLLLEYKRAKQAAEVLHELEFSYGGRFEKPPCELPENTDKSYKLTHELSVLQEAYKRVLERHLERVEADKNSEKLDTLIRTTKHVPVSEKIRYVYHRLSLKGSCAFTSLFEEAQSRSEIVATFLAVLELVKGRKVQIEDVSENAQSCTLVFVKDGENAEEFPFVADSYDA